MTIDTNEHLKNSIFGGPLTLEALQAQLESISVPYTEADCRTCPNPCDEGHELYPNKFNVDMESAMLGSVKPYHRQILISTGKKDWEKDITSARNSLAAHVQQVMYDAPLSSSPTSSPEPKSRRAIHTPGVFSSSDSKKISILNGSHHSLSDNNHETVLVFPDYIMVTEVPRSLDGAKLLWDTVLSPNVSVLSPADEHSSLRSWVLPYSCVILLCSHKRRDNRCHIAAAALGQAFTQSLEDHGWSVDTEIEHPSGPPLEELQKTNQEDDESITKQLQEFASEKKALILRNSHTGGHRYAGNCIIYTPQGSGVWYGRVSTHEVESIVSQTLEEGLVLPPLLRGGMNISRPGCKSLHDW